MSIRNFIVSIAICISPLLAQNPIDDISKNPIVSSIRDTANKENIPNSELEKAYIAFRAAYNYGHLLEFEGCEDFGELFDKMRLITGRLKYVQNMPLSDASYKILAKYEDLEFNSKTKSEFTDDVYYISLGLEKAMD